MIRVNRIALKVTVGSTHKSGEPVPIWVELGTAPHVITPKSKSVLRWISKETGGPVFAKQVFHPGTEPNPYFRRGIAAARRRAKEAFRA